MSRMSLGRLRAASKALANFFEECTHRHRDVKLVSNWIMSELLGYLNREVKEITESPVTPTQLAALLKLIQEGIISGKIAKAVFEEMYQTGKSPETIIQEKGLVQITDREELGRIVDQVLAENPGPVADFKGGKGEVPHSTRRGGDARDEGEGQSATRQ